MKIKGRFGNFDAPYKEDHMSRRDRKLYLALLLYTYLPSVYLLIRMYVVTVSGADIDIIGQMEWFDLIDEVLMTFLTVPLYSILKTEEGRRYTGFVTAASVSLYLLFSVLVYYHISGISFYMHAAYVEQYLRMQTVTMAIGFVTTILMALFLLRSDVIAFAILFLAKLFMLIGADLFFIPRFSELGAAYSELAVNCATGIIAFAVACRREYFTGTVMVLPDKRFVKDWLRRGGCAGFQIFLDNWIYAVMVCKMVNAVSESGAYWIANNFIWGWLLVPVTCFAEIVKKRDDGQLTRENTWIPVGCIVLILTMTAPFWTWFMRNAMHSDTNVITGIVFPLMPYYLTYIVSAVFDAWFVANGYVWCNALISFLVNVVYYGAVYLLFCQGIFACDLKFIIDMFGFGMLVHSIASIMLYCIMVHRKEGKGGDMESEQL